jgi:hypothetical protein
MLSKLIKTHGKGKEMLYSIRLKITPHSEPVGHEPRTTSSELWLLWWVPTEGLSLYLFLSIKREPISHENNEIFLLTWLGR